MNSSFKGTTIISIPSPSWASLPPTGALQWPLDSCPACVSFPGISSTKISCTEISKSLSHLDSCKPSTSPAPSTKDLTRRLPELAAFQAITLVAGLKRNSSTIYTSFQLFFYDSVPGSQDNKDRLYSGFGKSWQQKPSLKQS